MKKSNVLKENLSDLFIAEIKDSQEFHPKNFNDYLGQKELKEKLELYTKAALIRNEPLDHMLLFGPPGLGKTTLAQIMATIMSVSIKICNGPMLEKTGDIVSLLSSLEQKDILFIDEIHRMRASVEEVLYNAMEHFKVDIIIGQGAGAKSVNLPISKFTLIGATTKVGMLSAPLRSRFGITERLDFYSDSDLKDIILQNALFFNINLSNEAALTIAKASRATPRIAKKILKRVRDFAQVKNISFIDSNTVEKALEFLSIDKNGLTFLDHKILNVMIENFNSGPVGLETIAAMVGEDKDTIEDVYEPYLMRCGYIEKTSRGRKINNKKLSELKYYKEI